MRERLSQSKMETRGMKMKSLILLEVGMFRPVKPVGEFFAFPLHGSTHNVYRLPVHLENQQMIIYAEGEEQEAVERNRSTKLTRFFDLCRTNELAQNLTYPEVATYFVWKNENWKLREKGGETVLVECMLSTHQKEKDTISGCS